MPSAGDAEMHEKRSQSGLGGSTHDHGTERPGLRERFVQMPWATQDRGLDPAGGRVTLGELTSRRGGSAEPGLEGQRRCCQAGKGERARGGEKAGLHFTLQKFSPPGNQRLWKDEERDGVQRGAVSARKHLLLFSIQARQWGEMVRPASPGQERPTSPAGYWPPIVLP